MQLLHRRNLGVTVARDRDERVAAPLVRGDRRSPQSSATGDRPRGRPFIFGVRDDVVPHRGTFPLSEGNGGQPQCGPDLAKEPPVQRLDPNQASRPWL